MAFDAHKNFAVSTVATAPSPATSGTTLTVATGDGAKFPAAPFNCVVCPAGTQPSDANAEVIRVTSKGSGDNWTIIRAQEGSSARSIIVGDQIANVSTAKVFTDIEALIPSSAIQYVAAPTGTAATDTAAIQAAHDSFGSSGGEIVLQPGSYAIDPSSPLSFSKPIILRGAGRDATTLTFDSATATAISISTSGVILRDFILKNTHATAPTAGAGIAVTAGGIRGRFIDLEIWSFYVCVDQQRGGCLFERCLMYDYKSIGIKVQNLDATDSGNTKIVNTQFNSSVAATTYGILFNSGGNLAVIACQFYGGDAGHSNVGICFSPLDGVNTSDLIIVGNSIENFVYGILGQLPGSATGELQGFLIVGNEIFATTGGDCINFDMSTSGRFSRMIITGNLLTNGTRALVLGNVTNVTYGPNTTEGNTPVVINAGVTQSVGSGGAMTKLFDSILSSDTASIDTGAGAIPSGFSSLRIEFIGRTDDAATTGGIDITVNNDTSAIYDVEAISAQNAAASAIAAAAGTKWGFSVTGASALANYAGVVLIEIPGYERTTFFKTGRASIMRVTDTVADYRTDHQAVGYRSTSAISRVKVAARSTAKLKAGSRLVIYGLP